MPDQPGQTTLQAAEDVLEEAQAATGEAAKEADLATDAATPCEAEATFSGSTASSQPDVMDIGDFLGSVNSDPAEDNAGDGGSSLISERIEQDIRLMHEGIRLMLTNKLAEAEYVFQQGVESASSRKLNTKAGEHDHRGAFAFTASFAAMLRGLATLESNQLENALERLKHAESFVDADTDWPGKTVLKGLCVLLIGVVHTMQGNLTRGVWLMLRSWLWLRLLESEALNYSGPERQLVRSVALIALGVFNLIVSLLPPYLMRTANWLSGVMGDRTAALGLLRTCWEEDGIMAAFAGIAIIGYQVDVRTFLGEPAAKDTLCKVDELLSWGEARFPGSFWFDGLRANYFAVSREVDKALEMADRLQITGEEFQAIELLRHARHASYAQACLCWPRAAQSFRKAVAVYHAIGRRSLVPAMALNAALCHELADEKVSVEEMLAMVEQYKARKDKRNWGSADKWAFELVTQARAGNWEPRLELYSLMIMKHRSTLFMSLSHVKELSQRLHSLAMETFESQPDNQCRCMMLQAELLRQSADYEGALRACADGFQLQSALSNRGAKSGAIQYMHYVSAAAHYYRGELTDAKAALNKLDACRSRHDLQISVAFKATQLRKHLGVELQDTYVEVSVPARRSLYLDVQVPAGCNSIEWEVTLAEFSINFVASFTPNEVAVSDAADDMELQRFTDYQATSGPMLGSFEAPGTGTLTFTLDNTFSRLRKKTLLCRVQPDHLVVQQRTA